MCVAQLGLVLVKGGENCVSEGLPLFSRRAPFAKKVKAGTEHRVKLPDAAIHIVDGDVDPGFGPQCKHD